MINAISGPMIRNVALATLLTLSASNLTACSSKPAENTQTQTELVDNDTAQAVQQNTIFNMTSHQACKHVDEKYKEVMGVEPKSDIYKKYGTFAGTVMVQTEAAQNRERQVFENYRNHLETNIDNTEFTNKQLIDVLGIEDYYNGLKKDDMAGHCYIKPLIDETIKNGTPDFTKVSETLDQLATHIESTYCGYDRKEDDAKLFDFYKTFVQAYDQEKNGQYNTIQDLADVIMFKTTLINRFFFMCNLLHPEDIPGMEDYVDENFTNYFIENL